jgi:hypothetical protein
MPFDREPLAQGGMPSSRIGVALLLGTLLCCSTAYAYSTYANFKFTDTANPPAQSITVDTSNFSAPGTKAYLDPFAGDDLENRVRLDSGMTFSSGVFNPSVEAQAHASVPDLNGQNTTFQSTGQLEYSTKVTIPADADPGQQVPVIVYITHYSSLTDINHASTLGYIDILNTANIGHDVQLFYFCNASDKSGCAGSDSIVSLMVTPGYSLLTSIEAVAYANGGNSASSVGGTFSSSADAVMDPYFSIDPSWSFAHPGYSLSVEPGFGNSAPVPEPAALWLGLVGAASLAAAQRLGRLAAPCAGHNTQIGRYSSNWQSTGSSIQPPRSGPAATST